MADVARSTDTGEYRGWWRERETASDVDPNALSASRRLALSRALAPSLAVSRSRHPTANLRAPHPLDSVEQLRRQVAAGEVCIEQNYLSSLFRSVDQTKAPTQPKLTDRDKIVLRFIFHGLTNKDIAARLEISEGAVKASLRQLFDKLGVRTRAQLVKVALEQYKEQL